MRKLAERTFCYLGWPLGCFNIFPHCFHREDPISQYFQRAPKANEAILFLRQDERFCASRLEELGAPPYPSIQSKGCAEPPTPQSLIARFKEDFFIEESGHLTPASSFPRYL